MQAGQEEPLERDVSCSPPEGLCVLLSQRSSARAGSGSAPSRGNTLSCWVSQVKTELLSALLFSGVVRENKNPHNCK